MFKEKYVSKHEKKDNNKSKSKNDTSANTFKNDEDNIKHSHVDSKSLEKINNEPRIFDRVVRIVTICILSLLVICAIVSFVQYLCSSNNLSKQSYAISEILSNISDVDNTIVELNNAISGDIDKDSLNDLNIDKQKIDNAKNTLYQVQDDIDDALKNPDEYSNTSALSYLKECVAARLKMLDIGFDIYTSAKTAATCIDYANNLSDYILSADEDLKKADEYLNSNSKDKFLEAQDKSKNAKTYLELAKKTLAFLKENNVDINYQEYEQYIDKKLESCDHSIKSIDAIISEDASTADAENKLYVESAQKAQENVENFTTVPAKIIRTHYDLAVKDKIVAYKSARETAATNDSLLKNLLNSM